MSKRPKNAGKCQPASLTNAWSSLFINASEERFCSPLLLNFLCLTHAPGKTIERLSETYSEREQIRNENSAPTIIEYQHPCVAGNEKSVPLLDKECGITARNDDDNEDENSDHRVTDIYHKDSPQNSDSTTIETIFSFLQVATDNRITKARACQSDGKTIRKKFARDIILLLGTFRLKIQQNDAFMGQINQLTQALEKCVNDMSCLFHVKQCLKNDHRECDVLMKSSSFLDNGATLDIMTRQCIVMVDELQKKALNIAIRRQHLRREIEKRLAQSPPETLSQHNEQGGHARHSGNTDNILEARDVANALKDAYEREEELLEQSRKTFAQVEHIIIMIDTARQSIVKISSLLMEWYRSTLLRTRQTQDILTRIPGIPTTLIDNFAIETFCTDLLQTVEVIRQFGINADKLIENGYHNAIKQTLWPMLANNTISDNMPSLAFVDNNLCHTFSQKYDAIDRLHLATLSAAANTGHSPADRLDERQNEDSNTGQRDVKRLFEIYAAFIDAIKQTRHNVDSNTYQMAPHDIRLMAFCFFSILGKRLSPGAENDTVTPDSLPTKNNNEGFKKTPTSLTESPSASLDEMAIDQINRYETEHLIGVKLTESTANIPYLAKRHLTARGVGDMAVQLRKEQNIFQLDYLINAISRQMADISQTRYNNQNKKQRDDDKTSDNEQNKVDPAIDEQIVSSLHRINDANFDLNARTWKNAEKWPYANIDIFRFTHLAASLANLKKGDELKRITELVALYAYLLSYKLEQILFIPRAEQERENAAIHDNRQDSKPQVPRPDPSLNSDTSIDEDSQRDIPNVPPPDNRRAFKRRYSFHGAKELEEDNEAPLPKRKLLYESDDDFSSGEEMPMIIGEPIDNEQATTQKTVSSGKRPAMAYKSQKTSISTGDTYLRKPKYRRKKIKSYAKIYRAKQQNALRMFYRNDAITNLDDILQGVRFEKRRHAHNIGSYEKMLRRLNMHLNKLQQKK